MTEGREGGVLVKYLPSLTYRKPGPHVRNGLEGGLHQGGGQVSPCKSAYAQGNMTSDRLWQGGLG